MNAFENAQLTEVRGMAALLPFLTEHSNGQLVLLERGPLARALQETRGDLIFSCRAGRAWSVEVKVEDENKYGNFFLETWSNRNLENGDRHIKYGSNPGWMLKVMADLLLYYFIKSDELYVMDLFKLKQWAFGSKITGKVGRLYDFEEKVQWKRDQANDTCGRPIPIKIIGQEVGFKKFQVKQLPLFDDVEVTS